MIASCVYFSEIETYYSLWMDGCHYDMNTGRYIPIRYANGCEDIFTYSKRNTLAMIDAIQNRNDGSRVAFWGYGTSVDLSNCVNPTNQYYVVRNAVRSVPMYPGPLYSPSIRYVTKLLDHGRGA